MVSHCTIFGTNEKNTHRAERSVFHKMVNFESTAESIVRNGQIDVTMHFDVGCFITFCINQSITVRIACAPNLVAYACTDFL